jgi:hypothetical protein
VPKDDAFFKARVWMYCWRCGQVNPRTVQSVGGQGVGRLRLLREHDRTARGNQRRQRLGNEARPRAAGGELGRVLAISEEDSGVRSRKPHGGDPRDLVRAAAPGQPRSGQNGQIIQF